jgi:hypothetical protein
VAGFDSPAAGRVQHFAQLRFDLRAKEALRDVVAVWRDDGEGRVLPNAEALRQRTIIVPVVIEQYEVHSLLVLGP